MNQKSVLTCIITPPRTPLLALVVAAVVAGSVSARGQSFVNGSFETGDFTGWTHGPASTVDYPGSDGPWAYGYDGNHWAWLGNYDYARSQADTFIEQTVSGFVAGRSYTLSFLQSSEAGFYPVANGNIETTFVDIIGTGTLSSPFDSPPSNGSDPHGRGLWNVWQPETWSFVADASSLTFKISGNYGGLGDTGVDKFAITPNQTSVPDGGVTLTLLGIAVGGLACLRRKF